MLRNTFFFLPSFLSDWIVTTTAILVKIGDLEMFLSNIFEETMYFQYTGEIQLSTH